VASSARRISASAARPTSSWRSSGSRVPLAPREHLDGGRGGGDRDRAAGQWPRPLDRAAQEQRAREVGGEHRRDEVRAATLVLLRRVGRIGRVGLVGADRLVLDAVVGGKLTAPQGEQRRHERDQPGRDLPARAAHTLAQDGPAQRGAGRDGQHGRVLERQPGLRQPALDERDHGERLGEPGDAAHARDRVGGAQPRLAAARHLHRARVGAHGGGPVRRPVHEQPVPQGHPAEAQLSFLCHASSLLGRSAKNSVAKPRSRTSSRSSAECMSGQDS
jgi:hypothetical protein